MKDVYTHLDSARMGLYKSLLDEAGIACFIRNEITANMMSAVPIPAFYPTLCIINDNDFDRARAIMAEFRQPSVAGPSEWTCPHCQSQVPAEFGTCWNCERPQPTAT